MKIRRIFLCLIALVLFSSAVISCNKTSNPEPDPEPEFVATAITNVLTKANNESIGIEGVVYGVAKNGFFLSDSENGHIFVNMTSSWDKATAIGDKVQVTGQFSLSNGYPQVKNVTKVTKLSSGNATLAAAESTVQAVKAIANDKANVGKLVKLVGSISMDTTNSYLITDDEGKSLYIDSISNEDLLATYKDQRVIINVVVYKYSNVNEDWSLCFAGQAADIVANPITFAEVLEKAQAHIEDAVPTDVYGALVLPSKHTLISSLTYTWSVDTNEYISIADNKATIVTDTADHDVTLHCLVSNGTESQTIDYPITLKGIVERTVSGFYDNLPQVDNSEVIVVGIVVAKTRNQSLNLRSLIIMDPATKETISADYGVKDGFLKVDDATFAAAQQGDEVVIRGHYRTGATDRATILDLVSVETRSTGNSFAHDIDNAYVLNDLDSYNYLADNIQDYTNKLVKFENPYMIYSVSSTPSATNWLQFGPASDKAASGLGTNASVKRKFAFLLGCADENLGGSLWRTSLDIPLAKDAGGAKQFGITFYAYALYLSDSYVAFIIPDQDSFIVPANMEIERDILGAIPSTIEDGQLTLAASHAKATGEITWASDNTNVIGNDGTVKSVAADTEVTMTATFYVGTDKYEVSKVVTVLYSEPKTVTEALAATDGATVKVKGVVIGFSSDGNTQEARKGIMIMDNANGNVILVDGIGILYETTHYDDKQGHYVDKNGTQIAIGQEVVVKGIYGVDSAKIGDSGPEQTNRKHIEVSAGEVAITGTAQSMNFAPAYTVNNATELEALFTDGVPFGKVIKLVGTAENPVRFGGSSSSGANNVKVYMANAADNAGTKIKGCTIALKTTVNAANVGDNWLSSYFGLPENFVAPKTGVPGFEMIGEMYIVISHNTSTYYQAQIVNFENWTLVPADMAGAIFRNTPANVEGGTIDLKLPESLGCVGAITYESNDAAIDLTTNTATAGASEKEVVITATYTIGSQQKTAEFTVTIAAATIEYKSVSYVVALKEDTAGVYVEGVVAGFAKDGANTKVLRYGVIVIDPATGNTVLVNNFADITYPTFKDSADATIKIGDKVQIAGDYVINADATGGTAVYSNAIKKSKITVVESNITLDYSKMTAVKTVTTDAELTTLLASANYYDAVIKVTGTAENLVYGRRPGKDAFAADTNMLFHMNSAATDLAGCKYGGKGLVINVSTAAYLGSEWYSSFGGASFQNSAVKNPLAGDMYIVITHTTGSYYQAAVVNFTSWTLAAYSA